MRGINAAVVGLLAAALYDPIWLSSVKTPQALAIASLAFALLAVARVPPIVVVALTAISGLLVRLA